MIDRLLPAAARVIETRAELPESTLFPAERRLVSSAVGARGRQFATARACAHDALKALGCAPAAILRGEHGEPLWPPGVVGSITHTRGYCAAAVARAAELASIGIDAEPNEPLPAGLIGRVALDAERERLGATARGAATPSVGAAREPVCFDRLLFSAKEAVYKAWFPLTGRPLGLQDVEISFDAAGALRARLLAGDLPRVAGRPLAALDGRWAVERGVLAAAVIVPPPAP